MVCRTCVYYSEEWDDGTYGVGQCTIELPKWVIAKGNKKVESLDSCSLGEERENE